MLTVRIVPCLDVRDGRVVKGVQFQGLRDAGDPVERALAYTRSYRETEGLSTGLRRATALKRVCADKSVTILPDELIVGMPAYQPRGAVICPEISWRWLEAELDTIATREQDPYDVTEERKRALREEVFPYWAGRSMEEYYLANLPAGTRRIAVDTGVIDIELKSQNGPGEFSPGYGNILLKKGFGGIAASLVTSLAWWQLAHGQIGALVFPLPHAIALGLLLPVMGLFGDLAESVLKRAANVKDSASYIQGMGGLLDVLDSLLLTAPLLFIYVLLFLQLKPGV